LCGTALQGRMLCGTALQGRMLCGTALQGRMLCNTALQGRSTAGLLVLHCQYLTETPKSSSCPKAMLVAAAVAYQYGLIYVRCQVTRDVQWHKCSPALTHNCTRVAQEVTVVPIQLCAGGASVRFGFHRVCFRKKVFLLGKFV